MHFVSTSIYQKAKILAEQEGLDFKILSKHQQHPGIKSESNYLPIDLLFEVYEAADKYLKSGFSIRQGKQLLSSDYGTLGLAWRTCWFAKDILNCTERFMVLVTDQGSAQLIEKEGKTFMKLHRPALRRGVEMANETTFVMLLNVLREVTATNISPISVHFSHNSVETSHFQDFFQVSTTFSSPENMIVFSTKDLEVPTTKADQSIQQYLIERMQEEATNIQVYADHLLQTIKELIEESLPSGIPSLVQVADYVKLSPRTLKRRLANKSVTFRELVQQIQKEVALNYLKSSTKSIGEITFLTGFSEQSAFNRAFKRWTGEAPTSYRTKTTQ